MNKKKLIVFAMLLIIALGLLMKVYHNEYAILIDARLLDRLQIQMDSSTFVDKLIENGFEQISDNTLYLSCESSYQNDGYRPSIVFMVETNCDMCTKLSYSQYRTHYPRVSSDVSSYSNMVVITYKQYKITIEEFTNNRNSTEMVETLTKLMID